MEYGEDDDDSEETSEESLGGNSGAVSTRKPFWALWIAMLNKLVYYFVGEKVFLLGIASHSLVRLKLMQIGRFY